jgi:hypothetical protein
MQGAQIEHEVAEPRGTETVLIADHRIPVVVMRG